MAFTDNCDLYVAIHEDGLNITLKQLMLQRPSLFNYATADIIAEPSSWCQPVASSAEVTRRRDPLFTEVSPIPVYGVVPPLVSLSLCVQIDRIEIDLHPGNLIGLPSQLNPPLQEQCFALHLHLCGGIGCPDDAALEAVPVRPAPKKDEAQPAPPVHVPGQILCFCLDGYAVGHVECQCILNKQSYVGKVDRVEITDIRPDGLESNFECYIKTAVNILLRHRLAIPLETIFFSFPLFNIIMVNLAPTPNPPVANNPSIDEDQLKSFVTITAV